jgi:hypothetical protein
VSGRMFDPGFYEMVRRICGTEHRYAHMGVAGLEAAVADLVDVPEDACPFGRTLESHLGFLRREAAREGLAMDVEEGVVWFRIARAPERLTIEVARASEG